MNEEVTVLVSKDGETWKPITVPIKDGVARIGEFFWKEEDFAPHRVVTLNLDEFLPLGSTEQDTAFLDSIHSLRKRAKTEES